MTTQALTINFSGINADQQDVSARDDFVRLAKPAADHAADLADINAMMVAAASGMSARAVLKSSCGVRWLDDDTAEFDLEFFAWPSRMDLGYQLSASTGRISMIEQVEQPCEIEITAGLAREVALDAVYTGTLTPRSPAIDRDGRIVSASAHLDDAWLVQSTDVFRVYRLSGIRHGYKYLLTVTVTGLSEAAPTDIRPVIACSWTGSDGQERHADPLELDVPDCVYEALDRCQSGGGGSSHVTERQTRVYYSTCNGRVLAIRHDNA